MSKGWRYFATRLNGDGTEQMLATELELGGVEITKTLTGPDGITATITPEVARLQDSDGRPIFKTWSTAIYAEKDNVIRGGAILTNISADNESLSLTCTGFSAYPQGQPYLGRAKRWVQEDPMIVMLYGWSYLQHTPGGNLGLILSANSSPVRIGTPAYVDNNQKVEAEPYEWNWYSTADIGSEFDNLAEETPFDYVENHQWSGELIRHTLDLRYPSIGRRRTDLRFVVGENIMIVPTIEQDGEDFASEVFVLGSGEGSSMVKGSDIRSTDRLRRVALVTDKTATRTDRANAIAAAELRMRDGNEDIAQVVVKDHPNARLGSFSLGDEILIQGGGQGWFGNTYTWVRILSYSISPDDSDNIVIDVTRPERTA